MIQHKVPTLTERLQEIVELSYRILCNKVAAGSIQIPNEASMQMQLGTILNWVGKLYELDKYDHIFVELESPKEIAETCKSKGKARCDIYVTLTNGNSKAAAAIELKHLKKDPNDQILICNIKVISGSFIYPKSRGQEANFLFFNQLLQYFCTFHDIFKLNFILA